MKFLLTTLTLFFSFQILAETKIIQLDLIRDGGGQISAYVRKAPHGIRVVVSKCNFEEYAHHRSIVIKDKSLASDALDILEGRVVIAQDRTFIEPLTQSGSWFKISYSVDMSQFTFPGGYVPNETKVVEVERPLVIVNGRVSNVLERLESEARFLCN